jgi:hypothetical protein
MERRYLVVPGLRSSRIHITDTEPDPRQPKIVKIIEPETVFARTGYSRAHAGMQDTLELLRRNSHSAAEAVRAFTEVSSITRCPSG